MQAPTSMEVTSYVHAIPKSLTALQSLTGVERSLMVDIAVGETSPLALGQ